MDKLSIIQADRDAARNLVGDILGARYAASDTNVTAVARHLARHRIASQAEPVEALDKALAMIGRPAEGVHSLDDDDIVKIEFLIRGADLKQMHTTLSHIKGEGK
jgi:hypothetical protein